MGTEIAKIKDALHKLNFILSKKQKQYAGLVFVMAMISGVFEMVGVVILAPLLDAFLTPEVLMDKSYIKPFIHIFHLQDVKQVIVFVCMAIMIIYVTKNIYNAVYIWVSSKFSYKINRELSVRILRAYMQQGYGFFIANNSSRLLRGIGSDVNSVYTIISQLFTLFYKCMTIAGIAVLILKVTPELTLFLLGLIIFCFLLIQLIFRKPMRKYGNLAREYNYQTQQASLEAIQGSKEVLVTNRQDYFIKQYESGLIGTHAANLRHTMGSAAPAFIIEAICITGLMGAVTVKLLMLDNYFELLAQLSLLAVSAFRILPALGAILSSVNTIVYSAPSLSAAYNTLYMVKDLEKKENKFNAKEKDIYSNKNFERELVLSKVTFSYATRDVKVIDDLNMTIKKGTSVAFIGSSGTGKTTLSDIILGLLKPQNGKILMDGTDIEELGGRWNQLIGYVPQSIYMTDSSIRKNIAFGIAEEEIDDDKVWRALEMAQLKGFVEKLEKGLDCTVGELGVQFSGGQRQRIAIARALYNNPDILILDEATAALDTETETAVMVAIDALQGVKTLIIVAHRLTTIRNCDVIYEIKHGKAVERKKSEIFPEMNLTQ